MIFRASYMFLSSTGGETLCHMRFLPCLRRAVPVNRQQPLNSERQTHNARRMLDTELHNNDGNANFEACAH